MSDTPRTDNAICVRRWTERQGEFPYVPCEQQYVEPDFARELERELARVTAERDSAIVIAYRAEHRANQAESERDAALYDARRLDRLQAIAMVNGELYIQRIDAEGTMQLTWAYDSEELGDTRRGATLRAAIDAAIEKEAGR